MDNNNTTTWAHTVVRRTFIVMRPMETARTGAPPGLGTKTSVPRPQKANKVLAPTIRVLSLAMTRP